MLSAEKLCNISQCFIQSPLLFPPLSVCVCVFAHTCTFYSLSCSQLSIKVSSNNKNAILAGSVFLDCSVHFVDVVVRVSRVGEVHTHQFDTLVVHHDCRSDGPFADVLGVDDFCHHVLFNIVPTPCLLSYSHAPMNKCFGVSPNFLTFLASTFRSSILHPICM